MAFIISRNRIGDYAQFRRVLDEQAAVRQARGLPPPRIFRNPDDPHDVLVLTEGDVADYRRVHDSPQFRAVLERAGITERVEYYPED